MRPFVGSKHAAAVLALGLAAATVAAPGCGTDAVGVDACQQIETARCKLASGCGIDLTNPVHRDTPAADVDACIRFYHDQCLHGLASGIDPGSVQVNACVAAINTGNCATVKQPETDPSCAFLAQNAPVPDAGPDTADAFGGCPTGCTDFGVEFCNGAHFCACTSGALSTTPSNCTPSSTNVAGGGAGYCCQ